MAGFRTDFELIPPDTYVLDPDEELSDFFDPDAFEDEDDAEEAEGRPIGRNLSYDPITGQFGDWVTGPDAVAQVAQMAMLVRRGTWPMFPSTFGRMNPEDLIGHMDEPERLAVHRRDIRETLLSCHERITETVAIDWVRDVDENVAFEDVVIQIDGTTPVDLRGMPL